MAKRCIKAGRRALGIGTLVFMLLFFAATAPDVMQPEGTQWLKPSWIEPAE